MLLGCVAQVLGIVALLVFGVIVAVILVAIVPATT
jgi:hypothetical protein